MKTQYPMIPFPLIVKATDGDTEIKVWSLMKSYVEEWKPD